MSDPVENEYTLTSADRCDQQQCGARAYWRFVHQATLQELTFCAHHGKRVDTLIDRDAYLVFDERDQLNVKLDASA